MTTAAIAFEKFGTAVKEAVIKTGWAMQGYTPSEQDKAPSEGITFTYADDVKPVQTWDEFVAANERTGRLQVDAMPPLVVVEPTLDLFRAAAREVIEEAGVNHVCTPKVRLMSGHLQMRYIHNGRGDCLVGRVLMKMGHDAAALSAFEGNGADAVIRSLYSGDRQVGEVASLAMQLQMVNDSQQTWGTAKVLL